MMNVSVSFPPILRNLSLRNKLLLSILVITGLAILASGYFFYSRTQQTQEFLQSELQKTVREQSQQQLQNTVLSESQIFDQSLANITAILRRLASYQVSLYSQKSIFADGRYWNASDKLIQFPDGQIGNSITDPASVFIPNSIPLNDAMLEEMNLSIYLDFTVPAILKSSSDIVALYFISEQGFTLYYPNVELAKIAPPDFDPRTQPYYQVVLPQNNPEKRPVWGEPYQDTAGAGLIVTSSIPVYDPQENFKGVLGVDVKISTIAETVKKIKAGKTGFAFLIDRFAHAIAMPEAGYELFNITEETALPGETVSQTLFGKIPGNFSDVLLDMTIGRQGVTTFTINDTPYYVAYAPLPTTGYSLGLLVPSAELDEPFLLAQNRISAETQATLRFSLLIAFGIFVIAAILSLVLGQSISNPLVRLTEVARQIQGGNLNVRAAIETNDEIGTLANVFNSMTGQIQESLTDLEQQVADRTKALSTSLEVSRRLSAATSPRQLAVDVVEQVQAAFGYYHAHIYFFDEQNENLVMAGGTGEAGAAMLAAGHSIPKGHGLVGRAAETNQPVLVEDVSKAIGWLPNPLLPDTKSEAAVPIAIGSQVLGVLDVQQNTINGLNQEDVNLLQIIAAQVAISYRNARAYEESASQAELEAMANYLGQKIQRAESVEETLQVILQELTPLLGAQRAVISLESPIEQSGPSPV